MDATELRKNGVCSTLRQELARFLALCEANKDKGAIDASRRKIEAYCDELDGIERVAEKAA